MNRYHFHLLLLLAALLLSGNAWSLSDYQRRQIVSHLDSSAMAESTALFDGSQFVAGTSVSDATNHINAYTKAMNKAVRNWNKLPGGDKNSAEGRALLERIQAAMARQKAMKQALPALKAEQASGGGSSGPMLKPASGVGEAAAAETKMNATDRQRMLGYLDSQALRQDKSLFDGQAFVTDASAQAARQYHQAYQNKLKYTLRTWNRMVSALSKATTEGQAMAERVRQAEAWGQAMAADYPRLEQAANQAKQQLQAASRQAAAQSQADKAAHKAECQQFLDTALTPLRREPMTRLVLQMQNGKAYIGSPEEVNKHATVATEFDAACKALDLDLITAKPCWFAKNNPVQDPKTACAAARQGPELIRAAVLNHVRRGASSIGGSHVQSLQQFQERNGWLTYEGPVRFKTHLLEGQAIPPAVKENARELLASAGLEGESDKVWGGQDKRLATLRAEVEKTAAGWPMPADQGSNYSSELAGKTIKNWHPDAKLHKAWLNRSSWKIHKNALGAILRRTLPGYVLFKLPDDPYCQLRSYTLTEQYAGGGNYEPASGVGIGYVRFQNCP